MSNAPQFAIVPEGFDPRRIDPDSLRAFRLWITSELLPNGGRYAEFLHRWLQDEEVRQHDDPDHVSLKHLMGLPNDLPEWELHEVAKAAYYASRISTEITCEMLGRLFDHQISAFTHYLYFQLAPLEAIQ